MEYRKITAIVDADYLIYKIGFGKQGEPEEDAIAALDETIYRFLEDAHADYNLFYLTSDLSFRKDLYPLYKANRKGKPKPEHYEVLRGHLVDVWCAEEVPYLEADDLCSMNYTDNETHTSVVIHKDKDLLQIVGTHLVDRGGLTLERLEVSGYMAKKFFYTQMLTGDAVDNVPPCKKGVTGPKTAERLLEGCNTEEELYTVVREQFNDDARMLLHAQLLWLKTNDRTNLIFTNHDQRPESEVFRQAPASPGRDHLHDAPARRGAETLGTVD